MRLLRIRSTRSPQQYSFAEQHALGCRIWQMDTFSDRFGEKFPREGKGRKGWLTGADGRTDMRVSEGCFAEGGGNVHRQHA